MTQKILLCFGTRPEVIKMAPIVFEMRRRNLHPILCSTGQHREMLDQMLEVFDLKPDYNLDLMRSEQSLNALSSEIFREIDLVFSKEKPDVVLVQGDTTTSNIIAQAAFNRKIKIGHVEAGLRTYNKQSPFPEEINRQIISRLADWHFTPTKKATENLHKEGIVESSVFQTGNTVVDALTWIKDSNTVHDYSKDLGLSIGDNKKMILVTGHRRENFGKGIEELCNALIELAKGDDNFIVFPVHLNPNTKQVVEDRLNGIKNITLLAPVNYREMVWLMQQCDLIISDSGGIQEEAPTFKKPVIVTRDHTEREEAIEAGFSILTGSNAVKIVEHAIRLLNNTPKFANVENPFGDGLAARRIVDALNLK